MPKRSVDTEAAILRDFYARMSAHFGPTHWWPGDSPFEVALGAILTQNTAWTNVEKAIANLKAAKLMSPGAILDAEDATLEAALRPSGYFRQKAQRVRLFCQHLQDHYEGDIVQMALRLKSELRHELLSLKGIGPETADDILLYACGQASFVVDTYTRRIFSRHGLVPPGIGYEHLRAFFEDRLPREVPLWQEYHGLIVYTAKDFCRTRPRCEGCPLAPTLKRGQPLHVEE